MIVKEHALTKSIGFWIIFALLSAAGFWFTYIYFPKTFSIVNLDIRIDRDDVIEKARDLSKNFGWDVETFSNACTFKLDETVQNYIELEAGGPEALTKIIEEKFYSPYTWQVRFFKEGEINETYLLFMPDGRPYGLYRIIPQDQKGPALSVEEAKAIALKDLQQNWSLDINEFSLVEHSQEKQLNERLDHAFTYELKDKKVGQAPYRLTLAVQGDQLTQVWLTVKVPEAFMRRYEQMRSYNETLAQFANILMIILYFIGGVLLSLIFLIKRRWLLIGPALWWSVGIAFLGLCAHFNKLPTYWMYYQTAYSKNTFLTQFITSGLINFLFMAGAGALVILVAESLSRFVFPHHLQLWKVWSGQGAHSIQVLGRTVGGYLLVGIALAYVIAFYFIVIHFLGWWSPAESLYDPDVLAQYVPWLTPVAKALSAGYLEECLYRAIPLSCAALLGQRYGRKSWWIGIVFILQAFIFGAAHASYPAQPFYARLVEILIPAFMFAFVFLKFGLLASIITHVTFDVILMSIPVFISKSADLLPDKIMIVLCSLIPLFIVLFMRIRSGSWITLPRNFYNDAWKPTSIKTGQSIEKEIPLSTHRKPISLFILSIIAIGGLAGWIGLTQFKSDTVPLGITRSQAIELARKQIVFPEEHASMTPLAGIVNPLDKNRERNRAEHIFTWRVGGKDLYHKLSGNYLLSPAWLVRFVNFTGDVAQRAEEYQVTIADQGTIMRVRHVLPEDKKEEEISEEQARALVQKKIIPLYPEEKFSEISALAQKHPERKDWQFTYGADVEGLKEGQKRITATVAGNNIIDHYRFVFVPESWTRLLSSESATKDIIHLIATVLFFLLLSMLGLFLIKRLQVHVFSMHIFLTFFIILMVRALAQFINLLPQYTSVFTTAQPYQHQIFSLITSLIIRLLFSALIYSALASFILMLPARSMQLYKNIYQRLAIGLMIGGLLMVCVSLQHFFGPSLEPLWPDLTPAGGSVPGMSEVLYNIMNFIQAGILALVIFALIDRLTDGWRRYKWQAVLAMIALAFLKQPLTSLWHALPAGIIVGVLLIGAYILIVRYARASIPLIVATFFSLQALQQGFFAVYPGVFIGSIVSAIVLGLVAWWWSNKITTIDS